MTRLPDWEERLAAYLENARERPFVWGEHDCALHGANVVLALTGEDHGAPFRGRYSTAIGSVRALKRYGAGTIEATFDAHLSAIPPSFAQRGDLAFCDGMVGVCLGAEAAFVGENDEQPGLVMIPRARWSRAWAVR